MEVLDAYKFRFAELMNKYKDLSAVVNNIDDKTIQGEIELAVSKILEEHTVDLNKIAKTLRKADDEYHIYQKYTHP